VFPILHRQEMRKIQDMNESDYRETAANYDNQVLEIWQTSSLM
jgi:hypothetical protein